MNDYDGGKWVYECRGETGDDGCGLPRITDGEVPGALCVNCLVPMKLVRRPEGENGTVKRMAATSV